MKIKTKILLLLSLGLITQPAAASENQGIFSSLAGLFSAPYIAGTLSSLVASSASNPTVQKAAVGLGLTALSTPYLSTWLLMWRAHAKFDDAIKLVQPPVDIQTINTAVNAIDNETKAIRAKIKEAMPHNKINPAFQEDSWKNFVPWCNAVIELNNKIITSTKTLREELNKNKSTNQNIKTITERTNTIEEANSDFNKTINGMQVTFATPYNAINASTGIIKLAGINTTRQAAINAINPLTSTIMRTLEEELRKGFHNNELLSLIRGKYHTNAKTRTATPLTQYSDDLTWYINRLWYLQIFFLGTGKRAEIQKLIENLKTIRGIIAGTQDFTQEQQFIQKEKQ